MKRNKSRLEYLFSPKNYSYFFLSYAEDYAIDCIAIITYLSRQIFSLWEREFFWILSWQ